MRGVAREQHTPVAVRRGLPGRVGEAREPGRGVDTEIGAVDVGERRAEVVERGFGGGADALLGHHDPHRPFVGVDHLAVADLVVHPAQGMDADSIETCAPFRFLAQPHLGDQVAARRVPALERDAGRPADHTASPVRADEVRGADRLAGAETDLDATLVLHEPDDLMTAMDEHAEFVEPAGHDPLDVVLPQPQSVRMPGGEIADVQHHGAEPRRLRDLPLVQKAAGDATLVEDLDRAGVEPARPRAGEFRRRAPLDNRNVYTRQRQFPGQHHPRRPAADDYHRVLPHVAAPRLSF